MHLLTFVLILLVHVHLLWFSNPIYFVIARSIIIQLPSDFVSYLQEEGPLILPKGVELPTAHCVSESDEESDNEWLDQPNLNEEKEFKHLIESIKAGIDELGGAVFPKLGWTSPRDAHWIMGNSLKCTMPAACTIWHPANSYLKGEVILLLKSSDFINYDLTCANKLDSDNETGWASSSHQLVLRKWVSLVPGMEFRCFVKRNELVAISQRHHRHHYDYVEKDRHAIAAGITSFLRGHVIGRFPDSDYVVDLYKRKNHGFWIIDFNPFQPTTDPLLFTWCELESGEFDASECGVDLLSRDGEVCGQMRCVGAAATMQPSDMQQYRIPQDFVDLTTGSDATKLVDLMRMKIQAEDDDSSSDDDTWRLPSN